MCGEKLPSSPRFARHKGSPPRVRGKGCGPLHQHGKFGITPACAGKRTTTQAPWWGAGDHPRVCGEKCLIHACLSVCSGSPPRVRGKGCYLLSKRLYRGITPACAGKRFLPPPMPSVTRDHPRVCGEKCPSDSIGNDGSGSPPRVRGKGISRRAPAMKVRITPACAGKRLLYFSQVRQRWDHPRVCGEKTSPTGRAYLVGGSPPRVRGKG